MFTHARSFGLKLVPSYPRKGRFVTYFNGRRDLDYRASNAENRLGATVRTMEHDGKAVELHRAVSDRNEPFRCDCAGIAVPLSMLPGIDVSPEGSQKKGS